ncbi:MAG: NAD+ synthase [Melioribacteraceae bacterium]|nr:NAD+ synthase [Melioribacteraceae bacterium]
MKIGLCQINPIIGDVEGNKEKILQGYRKRIIEGVDLVIFPELALCGYPPQDLLEKDEFRQLIINSSKEIAEETDSVGLIFGAITEEYDNVGTGIYNSAILCYEGKIQFIQNKTLLPNYDVFDEVRYFESAKEVRIHKFKNEKLGISICEDIWNDADYWKKRRYEIDPVQRMVDKGATLLINISASPYAYGRRKERFEMLSTLTRTDKLPLAYVCCVGAQTDLIFDGGSMCFNAEGKLVKLGKTYEEDFFVFDSEEKYSEVAEIEKSFEEEVLSSLILGIRDYAVKTGFKKALIGLSGGIDSALVTYIAVQALGKDNVNVVMLPSIYSSEGSIKDSQKLIENLGIHSNIISIKEPFEILLKKLEPIFDNQAKNIAEENIQARIRGLLLMGISNKLDYLLLTTGNKSEIAVGYATLYGDMCGALAVIGDVYKTDVYRICKFINKEKEVIPIEIIEKEPSAELRPNQKDRDSLPPYEILDTILRMYLEEYKEHKAISVYIKDSSLVKKVLRLVDMNEFKRKQAAPVLRVSTKAFGYGRRFPMVHKITRI